jgi:2-hydroxy-3-oxopropionate reductase
MPETVGFVGTGIMGKPMAANAMAAGFDVVAHNRSREPVEALAERGATPAESPAEVTRKSDTVVTVLPDTDAVESVVYGDDGVLDALEAGQVYVDMSTISPVATEEIAEDVRAAGASMLDAPISGGEDGAKEASLAIMVGGDEGVFESQRPLFDALGESVVLTGPNGAGQTTKACNQMIVACTHQAVGEALVFAEKAGADVEKVVEAISGGAASCWSLRERAPRVIRGNFDPGFYSSYQYKDLRIATTAGEEYGAPMPATAVAHELYKAMEETGRGRHDHSGVIQILEDMAGTEARVGD